MLKKILILLMFFCCANAYANNNSITEKYIPTNDKQIQPHLINWKPYMEELELKIKKNWKPYKDTYSNKVIVLFVVAKNGSLVSKQIKVSSKIPLVDKAAMDAIEKTFPFKPLPKEYKGDSVPIEFTFDYNTLTKSSK